MEKKTTNRIFGLFLTSKGTCQSLAKQILVTKPDMKCLFMSGYSAKFIASHGVPDEAVSFIQKPFSCKYLACKVREVLES